jgi:ATP-binding cassette subfamily B protein
LSKDATINSTIWVLVALFFFVRVLDEILWRAGEVLMRTYKPQMVERIRTILFSATLQKPHTFYTNSSSGRIGHWINQATATTNEFVDITIWSVWPRLTSLVVAAVFLLFIHWSIALVFTVWLVLLFWYTTHRGRRFGDLVAIQSNETSKASGFVVDSISNNVSVRVFNSRKNEVELLKKQQKEIIHSWRNSWTQNLWTNVVKGQSAAAVSVGALILVLLLFTNHVIPIGGIVLFIAYFSDASNSLWQLASSLDNYYRTLGTIQNSLDGLSGVDERNVQSSNVKDLPKSVSLHLKDLTFSYPERKSHNVIKGITVDIEAGQKLGIVGHSGSGKSTLMGLLLGFYEPSSGSIAVNEVDTKTKDPSFIRELSSFVPQDTNLFNRTIKENILYAKPTATDSQLKNALKQAEAWDFVKDLPQGLDTLVGERGVKLSGGQRQRIAIARSILKDAPLLLLDEATSALDSVSEQAIQKSLHQLMENRTAIVVAHRLSTLKHLDKIIVIENGKIAESGNHEDLLSQKGIYADLWKRQKDGFIAE